MAGNLVSGGKSADTNQALLNHHKKIIPAVRRGFFMSFVYNFIVIYSVVTLTTHDIPSVLVASDKQA